MAIYFGPRQLGTHVLDKAELKAELKTESGVINSRLAFLSSAGIGLVRPRHDRGRIARIPACARRTGEEAEADGGVKTEEPIRALPFRADDVRLL